MPRRGRENPGHQLKQCGLALARSRARKREVSHDSWGAGGGGGSVGSKCGSPKMRGCPKKVAGKWGVEMR